MDKPIAYVEKIIHEEDKEFEMFVNVSIKQMKINSLFSDPNVQIPSHFIFEEIATVRLPLTFKLKKNENTMNQLIDESIEFNSDHTWQQEKPY